VRVKRFTPKVRQLGARRERHEIVVLEQISSVRWERGSDTHRSRLQAHER
jgi:hypothetical protein